ncbi:hypothetical protein QTO34_009251 [Cnephaeus nilssonii]|uniref:Chemokine interleukin-8-like domain-containing protein n=1 Tax=Cnephaeus nilssonii TaxID=3371016 RepID=A0AA40HHF5_CNENI|nr:hypothetical protein QTO34_009251 [Eptesicus nilssonii]
MTLPWGREAEQSFLLSGKPLLRQDHEALCGCLLSPCASGCLLLSSALSTKCQTKKGRQVCANSSEAWVQDYMNDLDLN